MGTTLPSVIGALKLASIAPGDGRLRGNDQASPWTTSCRPSQRPPNLPRRAKDFQIFYFYPDDVRALHADWKAKGLAVTDLRVTGQGMREFELRDPDGYWLWFGQDTSDPPTVSECDE